MYNYVNNFLNSISVSENLCCVFSFFLFLISLHSYIWFNFLSVHYSWANTQLSHETLLEPRWSNLKYLEVNCTISSWSCGGWENSKAGRSSVWTPFLYEVGFISLVPNTNFPFALLQLGSIALLCFLVPRFLVLEVLLWLPQHDCTHIVFPSACLYWKGW